MYRLGQQRGTRWGKCRVCTGWVNRGAPDGGNIEYVQAGSAEGLQMGEV